MRAAYPGTGKVSYFGLIFLVTTLLTGRNRPPEFIVFQKRF
ncbi:hypothetical protein HMPREF0574_0756 [Mobiluncus curtisii subsp. curtisii ATCC 35241]|nr:hypothetical protein HMPREF0574_0756 [Mobiluncus curtisii subsp. curtisii ATCC 35241]